MNRRQLLAGLGAAAAGGGAALGTGAFTSVEANRQVDVQVADEDQAYLALDASSNDNGIFVTDSGDSTNNQLGLDFNDVGTTGSNVGEGVGNSSDYDFDDVFVVENQGTQSVDLYISELTSTDFSDDSGNSPSGSLEVSFYPGSQADNPLTASDASSPNSVTIGIGNTQPIGVNIDIGDVSLEDWEATVTVEAEA